ncbi:hypothetical protein SAMN02745664_10873 [Moraxella cuniculi DSM 21768]|uniref:Uncharacterized protein n=1 Tax=Moraxella cuniculi DSM 21768 TaxID=1122245 RepID=A0A1N7EYX5_9GAMM|nr:hypothetical protein [Moraxella cuniculi]OOS02291.1 hypothetical protein B0189_10535 [Moraxella cuniculi]SIR93271.1 hypothetical protein SAMN02745664_10873 [Moraxella cuniculi DSM 21768]
MEIREQLTVKEIFNLANMPDVIRAIPDKVYKFFEVNFDFVQWKWKEREIFWQFLDEYYPQFIDYQKDIVYVDELSKKECLIGSISWIFDILRDEQATLENQKIAFELTCCVPNFWKISHEEGYLFSDSSKRLALSYLSTIDTNLLVNHNVHINEKETIETLHISLKNCQWKEIGDNHHQISNIFGQLAINHHCTYSFIVEHHIDEILNLINNEKRVWQLLYWLALLPEQHKHNIVLKTNNQLAQFLLLLNLSHRIRNEFQQEQLQLSEIWHKCPVEWFQLFNKYPWLQLELGKFITSTTHKQIQIYIDSIELSTYSENIQECLTYFLKHAEQEKIHYFCKLAYQKWKTWDFEYSYSIKRSSLDRAIVKYFQDVATVQERADFIHNEMTFILSFNKYWFTNIVELHKFIYFHLSRMQPAYIADKLQQNNSLLFDDLNKNFYYPNLFQEDKRWRNWANLDRL